MELENIVANTVYLKAREGNYCHLIAVVLDQALVVFVTLSVMGLAGWPPSSQRGGLFRGWLPTKLGKQTLMLVAVKSIGSKPCWQLTCWLAGPSCFNQIRSHTCHTTWMTIIFFPAHLILFLFLRWW